ncbi:MAG: DNA-binding NtrC family response regulator [Desulforhopalus sp.]|jgi:DNA-binding NtrC family response regulator
MTDSRTILILDDDDAVRESFQYYFEDLGWDVRAAGTAEKALAIVFKDPPAGVVVDIRLPGMDGNSFILELEKTHPNVACVICTGSPEYKPPESVLLLPQVFEHIFAKPVTDLSQLAKSMEQHIIQCNEKALHAT